MLRDQNKEESASRAQILASQRTLYDECTQKVDKLIDMRASGELTEEEFSRSKKKLKDEKDRLHGIINNVDKRVDTWIDKAEQVFQFAEVAHDKFSTTKNDLAKKQIMRILCSKKARALSFEPLKTA